MVARRKLTIALAAAQWAVAFMATAGPVTINMTMEGDNLLQRNIRQHLGLPKCFAMPSAMTIAMIFLFYSAARQPKRDRTLRQNHRSVPTNKALPRHL
ncbi:hypothetical protein ASD32_14330 [Rhizobium sp. Root483D2]|nr:hypothetical protein ASD32_14330 [Rhizobium sp. Root483D2]